VNEIIRKVEATEKAAQELIASAREEAGKLRKQREQESAERLAEARAEAKQIVQTALADARSEAKAYRDKILREAHTAAENRSRSLREDSEELLEKLVSLVLPHKGDADRL